LIDRVGLEPALIEDVYAGCGNQAGEDNRDVARMSALLAGFPIEVSGVTVNRNCASGLEAVNQAAKAIIAGEADIFIGAGVECMSRAPWSMPKPERWSMPKPERARPVGHPQIWDTTVGWRYNNPKMDAIYPIISLGETAENIADDLKITRQEQDAFALESHHRAVAALSDGKFKDEITPIEVQPRKGPPKIVDTDEHPRYKIVDGEYVVDTSMEQLSRLKPIFRKGGSVTAANSSGINDGAAALLLMSAERVWIPA
jgi:acetyl-CoA acetyltransferase family protein